MRKCVVAIAVFVLLFATCLFAQTSKGTIAGTVSDQTGAVIRGAKVTAKDTLGAEVHTAITGDNGQYRIDAVQPSVYEVTVEAAGFATKRIQRIEVKPSVVTPVNTEVALGGASESVVVEATPQAVQTESAELSKTVGSVDIRELPVGSLNAIDLVKTQPGVVTVAGRDDFTNGVSFSVNGLRPRANNFLIDGFDNNDNGITGQAIQPQNLEAVKEVVIQTNSYAAEFGRGGGSVTNVIYNNGTNRFHGSAWELWAGSTFNAITSEQARNGLTEPPRVNSNTFGFAFGGPVVKNKLFIFASPQWQRNYGTQQGSQITIPTASGLSTLQSIAATNTQAQILLQSLGGLVAPTNGNETPVSVGSRPGCPAPCDIFVNTFNRTAPQQAPSYEYVVRGDYVASDKDTFTVRWLATYGSLTPDLFANPNALPGTDTFQGGPSRNLGMYWTHVMSPTKVNELRFTVQTLDFSFGLTPGSLANPFYTLPDMTVGDLPGVDFGGVTLGFPQNRNHTVYQYQDAFSVSTGKHNFKIGADLLHLGIADDSPFNSRGTLQYNQGGDCSAIGLATCSGLANFLDDFSGQKGVASKQFGVSQLSYAQTMQAYYFQDTWKLRPNFTLNYGLRYEYHGNPYNTLPYPAVNELTAGTDPFPLRVPVKNDRNNFGPRVGFAYSPHFWKTIFGEDKTVIRAGAGVFYDVSFSNIMDNAAASTPNVTGGTIVDSSTGASRGLASFSSTIPQITSSLSPFDAVTSEVGTLRDPKTYQWNVDIQRELPGNLLLTVAYVGTRGTDLFLNRELNPGDFLTGDRFYPNRGSIFVRGNHGDSVYHGLQTDVSRQFRHGLLFRGAWTYGRSIDNGSEIFVTSGGSTRAQDQLDPSNRGDRGPSAFDRKHRAVFTWVYSLPEPGWNKFAKTVLGGWEVSGSASFQTGAPETIHAEFFDNNGDFSSFNDRPFFGNPGVPLNYQNCFSPSATCNSGVGFTFDGSTFVDFNSSFGCCDSSGNFTGTANDFRYYFYYGHNGNVGRNTWYNPGRQDWSMAIGKIFKMPVGRLEGQQLELRMESLNPFNHPNTLTASGSVTSPFFLNSDVTRSGGRQVRFWLKYRF